MMFRDAKLAFLDVETTGLNPFYGDRICEIAILTCQGLKIEQEFSSLVNPQRSISPGAYAVNGISPEMVKDAPRFVDIAEDILRMLKDRIIVCHNADFDLEFLEYELTRINIELPRILVVDTLRLARKFFNFSSNSLPRIANSLGISLEESHRALSDVHTTRNVLTNFISEFSDRGINSPEEILITWQSANKFLSQKKNLPALPSLIEEVIKDKTPIKIIYISNGGARTERMIEPREVTSYADCLYLVGFCHLRKEERTFRLDRIVKIEKI